MSSYECSQNLRGVQEDQGGNMRHWRWLSFCLMLAFGVIPVQAAERFIVRINSGSTSIQAVCLLTGCSVVEGIDGALGQVFLVTMPDSIDPSIALQTLSSATGVTNAEPDLLAHTADASNQIPLALQDNTPVSYYRSTVPHGYISQPATQIVRLTDMRTTYPNATGAGTVAVIDTGIDPNHPALQSVLLPGYDFTRNQSGADETSDVSLSNAPVVTGVQPQWVKGNGSGSLDQSTAAVVDQSTAAVVDGNAQYSDFGHGTMVAGIVHLVAPTAKILPLKVFGSDGTGYTSDILRGIYRAVELQANVLNMSFHLASYSREVENALNYANRKGAISVAAAGNEGENTLVYPAALSVVMGVASTTNDDQLSSFSNYGPQLVWVAAPGEGIVTTYPFSTYAASWGTSFSTPFVSGTVAAMLSISPSSNQNGSAQAIAHAKSIDPNAGHGRLDIYQAIQAAGTQ
jgi:subtilisin family serine protease